MNRVKAVLRLAKEAKALGDYDSNVIGMAAEVIAESNLGLIKAPRGKKAIDGHIYLNGENHSIQIKAWSCSRIKKYRGNTFFRIPSTDSAEYLAVILILADIPDYEILYFGKSEEAGKLDQNGLSRTIKLSSLKSKAEIDEVLEKISKNGPTKNAAKSFSIIPRIREMKESNADAELKIITERAISIADVKIEGSLTKPRSYGVFHLKHQGAFRKFRFGNYPVRMRELEQEFDSCELIYLFKNRNDAEAVASLLNDV